MLFLGFSLILMGLMIFIEWKKSISFKSLIGLFLFGIILSTPFILVEYLGAHLKYYFVIIAFIAIELGVLLLEKKVKYFHDLIHHNIKNLRIISFILIGIGFTYSEVAFYIFHSTQEIGEIIRVLPIKTMFAILMHTVLASAASLIAVGDMFAETIFETIFKFINYYIRIAIISTSHYLYVLFSENNYLYIIIPFALINIGMFFYLKNHIDKRIPVYEKIE